MFSSVECVSAIETANHFFQPTAKIIWWICPKLINALDQLSLSSEMMAEGFRGGCTTPLRNPPRFPFSPLPNPPTTLYNTAAFAIIGLFNITDLTLRITSTNWVNMSPLTSTGGRERERDSGRASSFPVNIFPFLYLSFGPFHQRLGDFVFHCLNLLRSLIKPAGSSAESLASRLDPSESESNMTAIRKVCNAIAE